MVAPGRQWRCVVNGQQYGPISEEELRGWVAQGRVRPTDLVWTDGMANWQPLQSVQYMFRAGPPLPPAPAQPAWQRPHRGAVVLTLGILGVVISFLGILGGIAWYLANEDLRQMAAGRMDPSGQAMTQAGKICGIIGFVLGILGCCWGGFWLVFVLGMAGSSGRF